MTIQNVVHFTVLPGFTEYDLGVFLERRVNEDLRLKFRHSSASLCRGVLYGNMPEIEGRHCLVVSIGRCTLHTSYKVWLWHITIVSVRLIIATAVAVFPSLRELVRRAVYPAPARVRLLRLVVARPATQQGAETEPFLATRR